MGLTIFLAAMAGTAAQDKPAAATAPARPPVVIVPAPPTPDQLPIRTPSSQASFPKPLGPAGWISQDDYPAAAIRANAEGVVAYRLDIAADGWPTKCTVLESSKNPDLDAATCALLMRRGRFEPARDGRGRAIAGSYVSRVRWDLRGRLRPVPGVGEQVITLTVELDGSVSDCAFTAHGAPAATAHDPCKTLRFAPQSGSDARRRRLRLTTRVEQIEGS